MPWALRLGEQTLKTANKSYSVREETFESLTSYWLNPEYSLEWDCLFVLPGWLQVWWSVFGNDSATHLSAVRHGGELIGIAPLVVEGEEARFLGDPDVCDYQDFIVAPGRAQEFSEILLDHLKKEGITRLDLKPIRADSMVFRDFIGVVKGLGSEVSLEAEDVTLELALPPTWDQFLGSLSGKQRHEVRRKLRRLHEAGEIEYRLVEDVKEVADKMDSFLALFGLSRSDKATFMTSQMALYFRSLAETMAKANLLKLFFLDLDGTPTAAVMCFDYNSTMYLYNNGYDGRFSSLSVGLLSKVISIKESIMIGRNKFDFLKGAEEYKHRLGGIPAPLYRCQVEF